MITPEELILLLKQSEPSQLQPCLRALSESHPEDFAAQSALLIAPSMRVSHNPMKDGFMKASDMSDDPKRLIPIWLGIYPGKVAYLIGETGAGKSSLLYNIAIHAALKEPLWGHEFHSEEPPKILYVDPENAGNFREKEGGLSSVKLKRIGKGRPENLSFHDGQGLNLSKPDHMDALINSVREEGFTFVILDPIASLFDTKDENDNSEAARQMKSIQRLSRETGAAVLIVHHTGKDNAGNFGRGASSRLSACDVGIAFRARGGGEAADDTYQSKPVQRFDFCRYQIVKNRLDGKGSLYLQMAGEDKFIASNIRNWNGAASHSENAKPKAEQAKEEILLLLQDGEWQDRKSLLAALKEQKIGERNAADSLKTLVDEGRICQRKKEGGTGYGYSLNSKSAPENIDAATQNTKESALLHRSRNEEEPEFEPDDHDDPGFRDD